MHCPVLAAKAAAQKAAKKTAAKKASKKLPWKKQLKKQLAADTVMPKPGMMTAEKAIDKNKIYSRNQVICVSKSKNQLPDDAVFIAYIEACEKPPKLRDIARHFKLSPTTDLLCVPVFMNWPPVRPQNFPKNKGQADLPEIVLIDIIEIDTDGAGIAVIAGQTAEDQPRIEILPDNKKPPRPDTGQPVSGTGNVRQKWPAREDNAGAAKTEKPYIWQSFSQNSQQQKWMIEPADKGGRRPLLLLASEHSLEEDVIVEAIIKDKRGQPAARILRILGAADNTDSLIAMAIAEFDLPHHFSDAMLAQASQASLPEVKTAPIFAIYRW